MQEYPHLKPDPTIELNLQTGKINWDELAPHFARGVLLVVDQRLDLIEVAHSMQTDDNLKLKSWLDDGLVTHCRDEDAQKWQSSNANFWALVLAPWVLIQTHKE